VRTVLRLAPPLLLMAVIAWLSHRPLPVGLAHGSDKVVHFLVYGILAALWVRALRPREPGGGRRAFRRALLVAVVVTAAWGVLDEIHQSFVPGRDASPGDAVADTLGGLAGAVLAGRWAWFIGGETEEGHA